MLKLVADENFDNRVLRGLLERNPKLDVVRVQDVGLAAADDPAILEWAAQHGRMLLTLDFKTMPAYAYERVKAGLRMPGVCQVNRAASKGAVIEDILLIVTGSRDDEWENRILYVPLN